MNYSATRPIAIVRAMGADATWTIELADAAATERLGAMLSLFARPGDVIALRGELGAGKTTLARAFIRALDPAPGELEVPSPTFTLVQGYDMTRVPVAHVDLYRIAAPSEAAELGIADAAEGAAVLIEWPDRLGEDLPAQRLDVTLREDPGGNARIARLEGHGLWGPRLERIAAVHGFLERAGWGGAARRFLQGDASIRRYERLARPDGTGAVLSDMPQRPDGPPVKCGKPYSAVAHLAENVRPVVAVGNALRGAGFSAPEIYAADLARGLLIVEDLGDNLYGRMIEAGADMEQPYAAAVEALAALQRARLPARVTLPDGSEHVLPPYDRGAMQIEAELLLDWLWPAVKRDPAPAEARASFLAAWQELFPLVEAEPPQWTLRDYHSPNLFWLPERTGIRRVGIIDCQDAVLGHPAYDLVSLLQDARVEVFEETEQDLLGYYEALREADGAALDCDRFRAAYAVLGAQRATKILGIFARLAKRDAKPQYLQHLPRVSNYLERNLRHPALAELRRWFAAHLPAEQRVRMPRAGE